MLYCGEAVASMKSAIESREGETEWRMTNQSIKRIPYGLADYRRLRQDNSYYVDKTPFIPLLEAQPYFLCLLRPRRFGKSLWLSVLQNYYDINRQAEFDFLFGDTYIGAQPTAERNSYLVIFLNFALVNPDPRYVEASFEDNGAVEVRSFVERYAHFFDEAEQCDILSGATLEAKLRRIFVHTGKKNLKTYLLIDEYDNFANNILTTAGQTAYHDLTHGTGFFRYVFNLLKGVTAGQISGLTRLFITGVSPLALDDVSSGFNIGDNITLATPFQEMIGFSEADVRALLTYYHTAGALPLGVEECLATMRLWYDNYRFSRNGKTSMYNSDLVLYFMNQVIREQTWPEYMVDPNVRIDYAKLRYLIMLDKQIDGNFSQLRSIIKTSETASTVVPSFPLSKLRERENFTSQLVFLGLLTFAGEHEGRSLLRIPNQTIKDLLYSYIRDGFQDVDIFRLNIWRLGDLLSDMAYRGEWQPFFDFVAQGIREQTSIRDYLSGEKVIQGFLLAYLNVSQFFLTWSEKEREPFGRGGFADFYLEPFLARYPDMKFGYLVELEYIARSEFNDAKVQEKIREAEAQLARYANDLRIQAVAARVPLKKLVLIYNGWELVYRAEWQPSQTQT